MCTSLRIGLIFFNILFLYFGIYPTSAASEEGPYRTFVTNYASKCEKPSRPYSKDPYVDISMKVYNATKYKTNLSINITVLRNHHVSFRFKGYKMENEKWQLIYYINQVGCESYVAKNFLKLFQATNLVHNGKCGGVKGTTILLDGMDPNVLEHFIANKRQYGRALWRVESFTKTETVVCLEIETIVVPE